MLLALPVSTPFSWNIGVSWMGRAGLHWRALDLSQMRTEVCARTPLAGAIQTIRGVRFDGKPQRLIDAMNAIFARMLWSNRVTAQPLDDGAPARSAHGHVSVRRLGWDFFRGDSEEKDFSNAGQGQGLMSDLPAF